MATMAKQMANRSGTLDSDRTDQKVLSAMVDVAMPIAMQDADTYAAFQQMDLDYDIKRDFLNQQQQFEQMIQEMNLGGEDKQQLGAIMGSMFSAVISNISAAMNNPELNGDALSGVINEIWNTWVNAGGIVGGLYGYTPEWV